MQKKKLDLTLVRIAVGVLVYLAMLAVVSVASYALWVGPELVGVNESWPLVFYFVVPYFATLIIASGVVAAIRVGPGLVRRML